MCFLQNKFFIYSKLLMADSKRMALTAVDLSCFSLLLIQWREAAQAA